MKPELSDEEKLSDSNSDEFSEDSRDEAEEGQREDLKKPKPPTISILNLTKASSANCGADGGSSITKVG